MIEESTWVGSVLSNCHIYIRPIGRFTASIEFIQELAVLLVYVDSLADNILQAPADYTFLLEEDMTCIHTSGHLSARALVSVSVCMAPVV